MLQSRARNGIPGGATEANDGSAAPPAGLRLALRDACSMETRRSRRVAPRSKIPSGTCLELRIGQRQRIARSDSPNATANGPWARLGIDAGTRYHPPRTPQTLSRSEADSSGDEADENGEGKGGPPRLGPEHQQEIGRPPRPRCTSGRHVDLPTVALPPSSNPKEYPDSPPKPHATTIPHAISSFGSTRLPSPPRRASPGPRARGHES
jgi:hypothetical protein